MGAYDGLAGRDAAAFARASAAHQGRRCRLAMGGADARIRRRTGYLIAAAGQAPSRAGILPFIKTFNRDDVMAEEQKGVFDPKNSRDQEYREGAAPAVRPRDAAPLILVRN